MARGYGGRVSACMNEKNRSQILMWRRNRSVVTRLSRGWEMLRLEMIWTQTEAREIELVKDKN